MIFVKEQWSLSPITYKCAYYSVATLFLQINICETVKINYKTVKVQSFLRYLPAIIFTTGNTLMGLNRLNEELVPVFILQFCHSI